MIKKTLDIVKLKPNPPPGRVQKEEQWQLKEGPLADTFQKVNETRLTKAAAVSNAVSSILTGVTAVIAAINAAQPAPTVTIGGQKYNVEGGSLAGSAAASAGLGLFSAVFAVAAVYYGLQLAYPPHPVHALRSLREQQDNPLPFAIPARINNRNTFAMPADFDNAGLHNLQLR